MPEVDEAKYFICLHSNPHHLNPETMVNFVKLNPMFQFQLVVVSIVGALWLHLLSVEK